MVGEVYEKVDSLREEMEFLLEKKWVGLPLDVGWEGGGGGGGGGVGGRGGDYGSRS